MVTVFIPASLRTLTGGERVFEISAKNVREVVQKLEAMYPGIAKRLCEEDRLKPGIAVAIDSRICETGLLELTPAGSEVHFVPAVSGG